MTRYKSITNGKDLLEFLQSLSPEELTYPVHYTDWEDEYGMATREVNDASIQSGWPHDKQPVIKL